MGKNLAHMPTKSANMQTKRTLISLNKDALERLLEEGRKITHNPKASTNDCLYAVLGEYSSLKKTTQRTKTAVPCAEQQ
jgi:hypothetical protein